MLVKICQEGFSIRASRARDDRFSAIKRLALPHSEYPKKPFHDLSRSGALVLERIVGKVKARLVDRQPLSERHRRRDGRLD